MRNNTLMTSKWKTTLITMAVLYTGITELIKCLPLVLFSDIKALSYCWDVKNAIPLYTFIKKMHNGITVKRYNGIPLYRRWLEFDTWESSEHVSHCRNAVFLRLWIHQIVFFLCEIEYDWYIHQLKTFSIVTLGPRRTSSWGSFRVISGKKNQYRS